MEAQRKLAVQLHLRNQTSQSPQPWTAGENQLLRSPTHRSEPRGMRRLTASSPGRPRARSAAGPMPGMQGRRKRWLSTDVKF